MEPYTLMKAALILPILLLALPATAAVVENGTVRAQSLTGSNGSFVRLSVRSGNRWRQLLNSVPDQSTATNIRTLSLPHAAVNGKSLVLTGGNVRTEIMPAAGGVHVVSHITLHQATPIESISAAWLFRPDGKPGRPDFTWTPNLTPNADEVIGQHVFRSPAVVTQQGRLAAVLLPDLNVLDKNWRALPGTLNLDTGGEDGPRLAFTLEDHAVVSHVFWRHEPGETRLVGPGTVTLAYDILLRADAPPRMAYREATRWWWDHQGHRNLNRDVLPQSVPFRRYAEVGYDSYFIPVAWRHTEMDGETVGGAAMPVLQSQNATWFQGWFNDLRSAYGTYLWGKRMNRPDLIEKARQTRRLLLHSPQPDGLFPVIYDWDHHNWIGSSAPGVGGGPNIYHCADCAWAAYWLLMWDQDLEHDPASIAFCKRLGDAFIRLQLPSGEVPAYFDMTTMRPTDRLVHGAESSACGMYLTFLGRVTGEAKYLAAARKVAGYIRRDIWPRNKWFDYETFFSCSAKPESFFDHRTDQNPQNNLSIHWSAEMFRQLYLAGHKPRDLHDGEAMMDYLNLYQQVWSPSWMTFMGFGGYGVQNTDAEWNDARQAQFACTNLDYYRLTGKPEYLERGIAAIRAGFATMYLPENAFVSPRTYAKSPTGYADENYGHGGTDAPAGPTSWDWGTGSALASAAYAHLHFGDVWLDSSLHRAFGIDGVTADWAGDTISIRSGVQTLSPVEVRSNGKDVPQTLHINGKPVREAGGHWTVEPAQEFRVRHRAPAVLAADAASLDVEVWPRHAVAGSLTYKVMTADGAHTGTIKPTESVPGRLGFTLSPSLFTSPTQQVEYSVKTGDTVSGPFETRVVRFGTESPLWSEDFTSGPLSSDWSVETPVPGPTVKASPSGLTISNPGSRAFDQWVGIDEAPRVLRAVPHGDWSYTASLLLDRLPLGGNFQAAIAVDFGGGDFAFFGPFQGRTVTLERTGLNSLYNAPIPKDASRVELRVRQTGKALWFDWRPSGGDWRPPVALPTQTAGERAGMILKTWQEPMAASATFTSARMARINQGK